jgi:hypothetical protein
MFQNASANARSANVGLHAGQMIPDTGPPGQRHYRNTDVLAKDWAGHAPGRRQWEELRGRRRPAPAR